jgi:hypothetical protein
MDAAVSITNVLSLDMDKNGEKRNGSSFQRVSGKKTYSLGYSFSNSLLPMEELMEKELVNVKDLKIRFKIKKEWTSSGDRNGGRRNTKGLLEKYAEVFLPEVITKSMFSGTREDLLTRSETDNDPSTDDDPSNDDDIFRDPLEILPLSTAVTDLELSQSLENSRISLEDIKNLVRDDKNSILSKTPILILSWAQSGKTSTALRICRAIQNVSLREKTSNVTVFFTHCRILNTKQIASRVSDKYGVKPEDIRILHSGSKGDTDLKFDVLEGFVKIIVCCGTGTQFNKISGLLKALNESKSQPQLPTFTLVVDEADNTPTIPIPQEKVRVLVYGWLKNITVKYPNLIRGAFLMTATPTVNRLFGEADRTTEIAIVVPTISKKYRRISSPDTTIFATSSAEAMRAKPRAKKSKPAKINSKDFRESLNKEHYECGRRALFDTPEGEILTNKFFLAYAGTRTRSHNRLRSDYDNYTDNLCSVTLNNEGAKLYLPKDPTPIKLQTKDQEIFEAIHSELLKRGLLKEKQPIYEKYHLGIIGKMCLGVGMTYGNLPITGPITHIIAPFDFAPLDGVKNIHTAARRLQETARGAYYSGTDEKLPPIQIICSTYTRHAVATQDHIVDRVNAQSDKPYKVMSIGELEKMSKQPDNPDEAFGLTVKTWEYYDFEEEEVKEFEETEGLREEEIPGIEPGRACFETFEEAVKFKNDHFGGYYKMRKTKESMIKDFENAVKKRLKGQPKTTETLYRLSSVPLGFSASTATSRKGVGGSGRVTIQALQLEESDTRYYWYVFWNGNVCTPEVHEGAKTASSKHPLISKGGALHTHFKDTEEKIKTHAEKKTVTCKQKLSSQ